ncbi:MAG: polyphenol oxidase family protein, partial [Elusimicrobiaceae bacterium]|nr:polyphenol oxidase family protein [Elusimicrobiaceae bacterium]
MTIFTDKRLLSGGLVGGTLSRHSGNMREISAQNKIYQALDIPAEKILHFHQTHSDTILPVLDHRSAQNFQQTPSQEADAWVFTVCGWGGAILTADCVPLFLWDEQAQVFALAHCGWRGVVKQLPGKTIHQMRQVGARGRISGWLGPHIQDCCFEVQEDVAKQFSPQSVQTREGKLFVNLTTEIQLQLQACGLNRQDIRAPYYCTCGDKKNFFSWRRDHVREN